MENKLDSELDYKISVVMSVYEKDEAENFEIAVNSILKQTYLPSEIILIVDGPVPNDIEVLVSKYEKNSIFKVFKFHYNSGLGNVLRFGCNEAKYPIIARMDSDDIAEPTRFEKQIKYLMSNPDCDVVGTYGKKFSNCVNTKKFSSKLPITDAEIKKYMKKRCPFNHMTVMMKKSTLMKSGNYQNLYLAEDYFLWIRMYLNGAVFYNIPEVLTNIRVDKFTFLRRHGLKYYKSVASLLKLMRKNKLISFWGYYKSILVRFVYHVLIPAKLKHIFYK